MMGKRIPIAVVAFCILAALFSGSLAASQGIPTSHANGGAPSAQPPASASPQAGTQPNAAPAAASLGSSKSGSTLCAVTSDTAPPLSSPMAAALKLYRTGKLDQAIAAYNEIAASTNGSEAAAAYAGLARVYLAQKNTADAYAAAQKAVALTPDRAPAIVALGEVYFRQGKLVEAQAAFSKPLRACDLDARAFLGLNQLYQVSLNWKHAKTNIDQAFKLDPDDPEIHRVYMNTLPAKDRIKALTDYLAEATDDDAESRSHLQKELDFLQAESLRPSSSCRLVTKLKETQATIVALSDGPTLVRGYGVGVKVNGVSAHLLLDTGASGILIDQKIAEKAGVKSVLDTKINGIGDAGATKGFLGHADKIQIGQLEFDDCLVEVGIGHSVADSNGDGLIGADVFRHFLVDIYMPGNKLKLTELPPYPDEPAAEPSLDSQALQQFHWHDRYVPPEMKDYTPIFIFGHGLLVPTSVNSVPPRFFLIDTGAFDNTLSLAEAKEATKVSGDYDMEIKGMSGKVKKVYSASNATIQFANIKQQREDLTTIDLTHISDNFGTEISGILGFQMLWMLEMKIDYRDGLVNFTVDPRFVR
jgi:tetratricopeptide (TPR) repeat protein